ncbi:MAG: hypothetical protein HY508_13255 [Acidobacteria bacterium]|nr:hypothetical protein [Acidobacteriota bacterium]
MDKVAGQQADRAGLELDFKCVVVTLAHGGDVLAARRPHGALAKTRKLGEVGKEFLLGVALLLGLGERVPRQAKKRREQESRQAGPSHE